MDYIAIRHRLHQMAEVSGQEEGTRKLILDILSACGPDRVHTFGNSCNVVAEYDFGPGETLLFRGDFDAVRVPETIEVPYRSLHDGVSHKCGHDGHTAILLGLADRLHRHPLSGGRVLLFFQAAEETGQGAQQLMDTGFLDARRPDGVYALHNIPGVPSGTVVCREGSFTCSVISCDILLNGRQAHAAEPQKAVSPYPAGRAITDRLLAGNCCDMARPDFRIATLVEFRVGECAYGVAAGNGVLRFTLRAKDDRLLQNMKRQLQEIVDEEVAKTEGLHASIAWKEYFAASKNSPHPVERLRQAAAKCGLPYVSNKQPYSWGEDFGLLTQHFPGALFGLGSGMAQPPLHHPDFDFPDNLVPTGIRLFAAVCGS